MSCQLTSIDHAGSAQLQWKCVQFTTISSFSMPCALCELCRLSPRPFVSTRAWPMSVFTATTSAARALRLGHRSGPGLDQIGDLWICFVKLDEGIAGPRGTVPMDSAWDSSWQIFDSNFGSKPHSRMFLRDLGSDFCVFGECAASAFRWLLVLWIGSLFSWPKSLNIFEDHYPPLGPLSFFQVFRRVWSFWMSSRWKRYSVSNYTLE